MIFPLLVAIWFGLHFITFRTIDTPVFIGLANYREILADERFWQALRFTLLVVAITVPAHIFLGFVVALLLDQIVGRLRGIFLTIMVFPMIVIPVVGTILVKQMFEPSGLLAWFLREIVGQRLIFTESTVKMLVVLHTIWWITPFALVVFFAGLQTVPHDLIEAAAIDGASRLQQIRHVTIPHLRSLFVLNALMAVMDMFRLFDNVFVITAQNPIYKADTVMTYNFRIAMTVRQLGKGNAMAILAVVAILVALIPFLYITYREQIEER
jgi:multiple sugar transport system permease protein